MIFQQKTIRLDDYENQCQQRAFEQKDSSTNDTTHIMEEMESS